MLKLLWLLSRELAYFTRRKRNNHRLKRAGSAGGYVMVPQKGINQQIEYYWWKEFLHQLRLVFYPIDKFTRFYFIPGGDGQIPSIKSMNTSAISGLPMWKLLQLEGHNLSTLHGLDAIVGRCCGCLGTKAPNGCGKTGTKPGGAQMMCPGNLTWRLETPKLHHVEHLFFCVNYPLKQEYVFEMSLKHPPENFEGCK